MDSLKEVGLSLGINTKEMVKKAFVFTERVFMTDRKILKGMTLGSILIDEVKIWLVKIFYNDNENKTVDIREEKVLRRKQRKLVRADSRPNVKIFLVMKVFDLPFIPWIKEAVNIIDKSNFKVKPEREEPNFGTLKNVVKV